MLRSVHVQRPFISIPRYGLVDHDNIREVVQFHIPSDALIASRIRFEGVDLHERISLREQQSELADVSADIYDDVTFSENDRAMEIIVRLHPPHWAANRAVVRMRQKQHIM